MVLISPISPNATNSSPIQTGSESTKALSVTAVPGVSPVAPVGPSEAITNVTTPVQTGLSALVTELKELLDARNLQLLKQLLPNISSAKDTLLLLTEDITDGTESPLANDIKKIFATIIQNGATLSENNLQSPESILTALKQFASPEVKVLLEQVAIELEEKIINIPTRQEARVATEVLKHLENILLASHKDPTAVENLIKNLIQGLPRLFSPISSSAPELLGNKQNISEELVTLLKSLEQNLQEGIQKGLGTKELRAMLLQAQAGLNEFMRGASPKEIEQAHDLLDLVGSMQQLHNAQTNLQQLNSLLNTFGEPSLFLFATLIGGSFTKLKFTHDAQDEEGKKTRGKRGGKYSTVSLSIDLPAIGSVNVDLGYHQKELLLKVTIANETAVNFLKPRGALLRKSLQELGYDLKDLSIDFGEIRKHIVPETMVSRRSEGVFA